MSGRELTSRLRPGTDGQLISAVRARRLLYDPAHPLYSDNNAKVANWKRIGRELKATPSACKTRWNNIRDNYRKSLMRRAAGRAAHAHGYKYTHMLIFMNKFFKSQDVHNTEAGPEDEDETAEYVEHDFEDDETSEQDHDLLEKTHDSAQPVFPTIQEIKSVVKVEQQESVVDYEYFEKQESVSSAPSLGVHHAPMHPVDAFLAALSPSMKAMAPVHLSLAKAEIFAVVHKYEMKGLVEGGGSSKDVNPLT